MKKNIGSTDRVIRILIAVVIAVLYYSGVVSGTLAVVGLIAAAVFVVTGLLNFCPIYSMFGLSTRKKEQQA